MTKKNREQQDKDREGHYYGNEAKSPINKPGFLEPKLKDESRISCEKCPLYQRWNPTEDIQPDEPQCSNCRFIHNRKGSVSYPCRICEDSDEWQPMKEPVLKDEIIPADEILAGVINFDLQVIRNNPDVIRVLTFGEALIAMEKFAEQFKKK